MADFLDEKQFYRALTIDLRAAKALVLIQSPFLGEYRIRKLEPLLKDCLDRRVRVCVFVQTQVMENDPKVAEAAELLISMGIHVCCRPNIHAKIIIIDEIIMYDGSLNPLSHGSASERMTRWHDHDVACTTMVRHGLNLCNHCHTLIPLVPQSQEIEVEKEIELLASSVASRRRKLRLSQSELAEQLGIHQSQISKIESGDQSFRIETLIRVCHKLNLRVTAVPVYALQTLKDIIATD